MRKIRLYYAKLPNMGDLLNPIIVKEIFGLDSIRSTFLFGNLSAIGSGLERFLLSDSLSLSMLQRMTALFAGEVYIWGTGFMRTDINESHFYRKTTFCAVRGELSKNKVECITNERLNIPTGDGGLLASDLLSEKVKKKYEVGIIPHFREQNELFFERIKERYKNSLVIDLRNDPMEVVKQISNCEFVLSSSLHGLIVADSFGIPNQHVIVSNKLRGDGFKFKDYYSSFDLEHKPIILNHQEIPAINDIIDNYKITADMVSNKKKQLIEAFPFK